TPTGPDSVRAALADPTGAPVLTVDSLTLRPLPAGALAAATAGPNNSLFRLTWVPLPERAAGGPVPDTLVVDCGTAATIDAAAATPAAASDDADAGPVGGAHEAVRRILGRVQEWLADERFADTGLVVVTRGAVATHDGERIADLGQAAVWGFVRAAQLENPGR